MARFALAAIVAAVVAAPSADAYRCERHARCLHRVHVKHKRRVVAPYRQWLERVARCESGGDWSINTGNGFYGGVQFTAQSWHAVGGRGLPHLASKLEQMYRAVLLLHSQGIGAWPECGR